MPTQIFDHSIRNIWCTLTFLLFLANNWVHYSDNKGGRLLLRRTTAAIFAPRQHDRTCAFPGLYARRHSPRVGRLWYGRMEKLMNLMELSFLAETAFTGCLSTTFSD